MDFLDAKQDVQKTKARWDKVADRFQKNTSKNREKEETPFEYLKGKNIIDKNLTVLDLGCGAGRFLTSFSKECKEVVGVDISEKMIEKANENIQKEHLNNAKAFVMVWQDDKDYNIIKKKSFDLVFASMTPAVHNKQTLEKMCEVSKKHCFLSGFIERQNKIQDLLDEKVFLKSPEKSFGKRIYSIMNILWDMGYCPEIKYVDTYWLDEMTFEEAKTWFTAMRDDISEEKKKEVCDFLKTLEDENGIIKNETYSKLGWIYWTVD